MHSNVRVLAVPPGASFCPQENAFTLEPRPLPPKALRRDVFVWLWAIPVVRPFGLRRRGYYWNAFVRADHTECSVPSCLEASPSKHRSMYSRGRRVLCSFPVSHSLKQQAPGGRFGCSYNPPDANDSTTNCYRDGSLLGDKDLSEIWGWMFNGKGDTRNIGGDFCPDIVLWDSQFVATSPLEPDPVGQEAIDDICRYSWTGRVHGPAERTDRNVDELNSFITVVGCTSRELYRYCAVRRSHSRWWRTGVISATYFEYAHVTPVGSEGQKNTLQSVVP